MRIRFIWPGKTKDEHLRALVSDYLKRLARFARCEVIETRESTASDPGAIEKESHRILEAIPARSQMVLLELKSREWGAPEFARQGEPWGKSLSKEGANAVC